MKDGVYTDNSQGALEATGRDFDVAIEGDGFFVVETPQGPAYTRNGSFTLSPEGTLIDANGYSVMTDAGEIQILNGEVSITPDGQISVDDQVVGTLQVVDFPQPYNLTKLSGSLVQPPADVAPEPAPTAMVRQGYLEKSNVDVLREMVDMISSYREFETGQRMIQMQDESLGKATNDLGRV